MRRFCALWLFWLASCLSASAWGWGSEGHRDVGAVADALLKGTPAAAQVRRILGSGGTLQTAAIWADCAKSIHPEQDFEYVKDMYYDSHCAAFDATPAGVAEMADYVRRNNDNCVYAGGRRNCHKAFHFADIPIQENRYDAGFVGAEPYDVVHAIAAAVARLQHKPVPAPFRFADGMQGEREALRLIAHFVGDLHQPLHVGSVYLSPGGLALNPDQTGHDPDTDTVGGNVLSVGHSQLHAEWDDAPTLTPAALLAAARAVPASRGAMGTWPAAWAGEAIVQARSAFAPIRFGAKSGRNWPATFSDRAAYIKLRDQIQAKQLARAGKRLAELLKAVWPR
ncbi:S1/P1 nuclease [Paucibacter sp. R3-3]|uniref:S1/P1 nuclease n=1 Tax=Roseateles agri TaxID=3098619 RepID=A0ABU5DG48_9BURK|nr:S1/P1 nuclease [Paucibacter sp. R3-3]MDY0745252.1 S1/P1 nuclease [Paucibacter sp. R3-3]